LNLVVDCRAVLLSGIQHGFWPHSLPVNAGLELAHGLLESDGEHPTVNSICC
jgi:hypothetical protein